MTRLEDEARVFPECCLVARLVLIKRIPQWMSKLRDGNRLVTVITEIFFSLRNLLILRMIHCSVQMPGGRDFPSQRKLSELYYGVAVGRGVE